MLKVVMHLDPSSPGLSDLNILLERHLISILSQVMTTTTLKPGRLQVRLGEGWAYTGEATGTFRIYATLNCLLYKVSPAKAGLVKKLL